MALEHVIAAKAALGQVPAGPEGAWMITNRAAQLCGGGLLEKSSGNNWNGYAVDIVCFPDGRIYDVLVDGGGANEPSWQDKGTVDPSRYRPAIASAGPGPVDPAPVPTPEPDLLQLLAGIQEALDAVKLAASRPAPAYRGRFLGVTLVLTPDEG